MRKIVLPLLSTVLASSLLLASCGDDDGGMAENQVLEFADLQTDGGGNARIMVMDNGDSLRVINPLTNLKADTVYRYVVVYVREPGGVKITSSSPTVSDVPLDLGTSPLLTDSVQLQSIWRGGQYINLTLRVWAKTKRHLFAFVNRGFSQSANGGRIFHLALYHNADSDMEAFPHTVYLSCPLSSLRDSLTPGRDSIYFTINEKGKGFVRRRLLY